MSCKYSRTHQALERILTPLENSDGKIGPYHNGAAGVATLFASLLNAPPVHLDGTDPAVVEKANQFVQLAEALIRKPLGCDAFTEKDMCGFAAIWDSVEEIMTRHAQKTKKQRNDVHAPILAPLPVLQSEPPIAVTNFINGVVESLIAYLGYSSWGDSLIEEIEKVFSGTLEGTGEESAEMRDAAEDFVGMVNLYAMRINAPMLDIDSDRGDVQRFALAMQVIDSHSQTLLDRGLKHGEQMLNRLFDPNKMRFFMLVEGVSVEHLRSMPLSSLFWMRKNKQTGRYEPSPATATVIRAIELTRLDSKEYPWYLSSWLDPMRDAMNKQPNQQARMRFWQDNEDDMKRAWRVFHLIPESDFAAGEFLLSMGENAFGIDTPSAYRQMVKRAKPKMGARNCAALNMLLLRHMDFYGVDDDLAAECMQELEAYLRFDAYRDDLTNDKIFGAFQGYYLSCKDDYSG